MLHILFIGASSFFRQPPNDQQFVLRHPFFAAGNSVTTMQATSSVAMLLLAAPFAAGELACSAPDLWKNTCFANSEHRIGPTLKVSSAQECCNNCSDTTDCKAWTFWDGSDCNLFSNVDGAHAGDNCVSGDGSDAPPTPPGPPGPPGWTPPPPPGPACTDCPNIIFSLTDDQDVQLGGWEPMVQTKALLQNDANGVFLTEWRIHTPICSPSRSETVSGRYFHNIKSLLTVPPPKLQPAASGHINSTLYEGDTFGVHLRAKKGYNVGMFGKSNFNTMEGFDRWFQGVQCGYGGTYQDNESPTFQTKASADDYATDFIVSRAVEWIKRDNVSGASAGGRPFFVYFGPHCPHTPAVPSVKYNESCVDVGSPRFPNYNWTNDGFHELVRSQPPLTGADEILIDDLARRRCQTLLSVDDANAALVQAVKDVGAWNNTYFVVSSDHGYNLGHHRIPSNKFLLYDHATRIPLVVRGPGVRAGNNSVLGTNVDYASTWLAMAGIETPATYDGRSILSQLVPEELEYQLPAPTRTRVRAERLELATKPWRTEQFHQYYNTGGPSPYFPQSCPQTPGKFMPCEGWAPGSSTNPTQKPGDLSEPRFPRDEGLKATIRPLDSYSNTYIGLTVIDPTLGSGRYKYGEYEYECTPDQIAAKACFSSVDHYQLFDLVADPWELHNIYNETKASDPALVAELAQRLRKHYPCAGDACP